MTGKSTSERQRAERQAAALRENLKRRKAQARARAQSGAGDAEKDAEAGLSPHSDGDWSR